LTTLRELALTFRPDISLGLSDNQVVAFFIDFPMTPISSQSDTLPKSYDKKY
jgi:hypothetical protein